MITISNNFSYRKIGTRFCAVLISLFLVFSAVVPGFASDVLPETFGYSVWFAAPAGFDYEVETLMKEIPAGAAVLSEDFDEVDALAARHNAAVAAVCEKYNGKYMDALRSLDVETVWVSAYVLNAHVRATPEQAEEIGKLDFIGSIRLIDPGAAIADLGVTFVPGDIDRDDAVTPADARTSLRYAVKLELPDSVQLIIADYDGDGSLTASDARDILRASIGL